jgi:hypothetical protein
MMAPIYGCLFLASIPLICFLELYLKHYDSSRITFRLWVETMGPYLLSLFSSITIYRLFFHSLRKFPGPVGARISKLWHAWHAGSSKNHIVLDRLYHQYGTFVRTGEIFIFSSPMYAKDASLGPQELTIFDPEALWAMGAPRSAVTRTPFYDVVLPMKSLANVRDPVVHDQRRRIWDQAFSTKGDLTHTFI